MQIEQERFEAWLFSQPDDREFQYCDNRACVICGFLKDTTSSTRPFVKPLSFSLEEEDGSYHAIPQWLQRLFGAALINPHNPYNGDRKMIRMDNLKADYLKMFPPAPAQEAHLPKPQEAVLV